MNTKWSLTPDELSDIVKSRDSSGAHLSIDDLAKRLHTDVHHGLSATDSKDISSRQHHFGANRLDARKSKTLIQFFLNALKEQTLIILIVASIVSIVLGAIFPPKGESRGAASMEGVAILVTVFIVAAVTAGNDYVKDKQFQALEAVNDDIQVKVTRSGKIALISTFDVVVGDIIQLETGDYIPADALIITSHSMSVDESSMTGEPEAVHKGDHDRFLLAGCMVMEGVASALIVAVGKHSQWGKIKTALVKEDTNTPLQEELDKLATFIGKIGAAAGALTFVALLLRFTIEYYGIEHNHWEWSDLSRIISFLIVAITIIVVAVPEGLPLAVTLSLAYSMIRMMKDQNLVRHLIACETMGSATCICSDKTGTLTQNRMTVVRLWLSDRLYDDMPAAEKNHSKFLKQVLCEGIAVNSTASVQPGENGQMQFIGAKTECALLVLAQNFGFDYQSIRENTNELRLFPFSSSKKRMSTLVQDQNDKSKAKLYCKGAAEVVLDLCTRWIDDKDTEMELDANKKQQLNQLIDDWAEKGLRTLTLAKREVVKDYLNPEDPKLNLDEDLTLVAIVGIEDPLREEVPTSIAQCKRAGINVRMLTGDNLLTAKTIGRRCGILTEGGIALEGPSFRQMNPEEIDRIIPNLQIIARCSPEDKLILVKHLRARGEVVGVTGDGTNDAPILREADVGFAMGLSGTEVAKSAADVIILDDNFTSIEKAVLWGRNVYDSIQKFIQFQLTVNVVALVVAFIGAVSEGYSPLNAIELLWVNLIMDTLAALALATEFPTMKLLDRPPHGRNSPLISKSMWRTIIGCAVLQLIVLFIFLYAPLFDSEAKRRSMIFNVFVILQLFNEINCRKLGNEKNIFENILSNPIFLGVMLATAIVQVLLVQFAGAVMDTVPLSGVEWVICIAIGALAVPWGILVRLIPIGKEVSEEPVASQEDEHHRLLQVTEESM